MSTTQVFENRGDEQPVSYRFPIEAVRGGSQSAKGWPGGRSDSAEQAMAAMDSVSRRIDDLSRQLNCLGYFDDDDNDRPRAA